MFFAFSVVILLILIGLRLAWYNAHDEEGKRLRLEARRRQRKSRRKPLWHLKIEAMRAEEERKRENSGLCPAWTPEGRAFPHEWVTEDGKHYSCAHCSKVHR